MKPISITLAALLSACTYGDDVVDIDNVEKKGIVDCNIRINKPMCKECGNGGTTTCCPPADQGWECDVLCTEWTYPDPRDRTKRYCA